MIIGVGIDVVDVARFLQTLERTPRLRARLFTDDEQRLQPASLAARFAAKEAVLKALGTGKRGDIAWTDVEVTGGGASPPAIVLHGGARAVAESGGLQSLEISISHDGGIAIALAVALWG